MVPSCSSTICWKSYHFFIELLLHIYERLVGIYVWVYFCVLYSVRLIYVAITWPIPHHTDFCAAVLSHSLVYDPLLCDPMDYTPPCSSVHGDSPGKNTGVGSLALLQGIFLTQRLNLHLLHLLLWQAGSLPLMSPGKPLDDYSFVVKSGSLIPPGPFFLLWNCFGYLVFLCFHMNCDFLMF